jgi:hypothetical protein
MERASTKTFAAIDIIGKHLGAGDKEYNQLHIEEVLPDDTTAPPAPFLPTKRPLRRSKFIVHTEFVQLIPTQVAVRILLHWNSYFHFFSTVWDCMQCFESCGIKCRVLTGDVPPAERDAVVHEWATSDEIIVLFVSKVANEGINLSRARGMLFMVRGD